MYDLQGEILGKISLNKLKTIQHYLRKWKKLKK